jgi:hypothetical protein
MVQLSRKSLQVYVDPPTSVIFTYSSGAKLGWEYPNTFPTMRLAICCRLKEPQDAASPPPPHSPLG